MVNTDFANQDLQGRSFEGKHLPYATFTYSDLQGVSLKRARLFRANFEYADLRGANLNGAHLEWANFNGADLRNASFIEANLRHAFGFDGANLKGTKFDDDFEPLKSASVYDGSAWAGLPSLGKRR